MAMARRAYYARIRSQPSLRSCCSRVSVREDVLVDRCDLFLTYVLSLAFVRTGHRAPVRRVASVFVSSDHCRSPHTESCQREAPKKAVNPVIFPYR